MCPQEVVLEGLLERSCERVVIKAGIGLTQFTLLLVSEVITHLLPPLPSAML